MRTPPALGTDQPSTIPPAWSDPPSDLWTRSWHATAPRQVVEAYQEGDLPRGWSLWAAHLRHRKRPAEAGQLWSDKTSPLLWAVAALPADSNTVRLLQQLHPLVRGKQRAGPEAVEWIAAWLDEATQPGRDVADDLECVAWSYALVPLARHAAPQLWWELLAHLLAAARQGEDEDIERDPVRYSLLAGELALSLAWQFPELKPCRRLGKTARRALSALVVELLDGEGMPHARQLGELPLLTATWTRCRAIGSQLKENCWNAKAERQYEWLVTQNLRLADPHGAWLLAEPLAAVAWRPLMKTALRLSGDAADREIADEILPHSKASHPPRHHWPAAAYNSEWAEVSVLQNTWSRTANKLVVACDRPHTPVAIAAHGQTLFSGPWSFEIRLDNQPIVPAPGAAWEQIAWESDEDLDYLELEIELPQGLRLQRSFLLARQDPFLLLADAVLGEHPLDIHYTSRLPLAGDLQAAAEPQHSEIHLQTSRRLGRVLPLALSEWSSDRRAGTLQTAEGAVVLDQTGRQSLFAPLFLDLQRHRRPKPLTWRQLSVGHQCQNEPADRAVGYRVQIGKQQWLIYRSLTPPESRTVLGQNLLCEMHVSRFLGNGDVEELLELQ